jgi:hypothetical protein
LIPSGQQRGDGPSPDSALAIGEGESSEDLEPAVEAGAERRRTNKSSGEKSSVRFPLAAVLAVVMVLAVSFGVAGVALFVWRAATASAGGEASGESGDVAPQSPVDDRSRAAVEPPPDSLVARDDALLAAITDWHDAAGMQAGPQNTARFQVISAALVTAAELERLPLAAHVVQRAPIEGVDAPASLVEAAQGAVNSSALDDPAAGRKLLVVELRVWNRSGQESLHYSGLNGLADPRAAALLVDDFGQRYLPLPAADGSASRRVLAFDIAPGHTLTDVLVFAAPPQGFSYVRLALPNAAIGRSGGVGFEIRREMIDSALLPALEAARDEAPSADAGKPR